MENTMSSAYETIPIKTAAEILGITVAEFISRMSLIGKRFKEGDNVPIKLVGLAERGIQRDMTLHEKLRAALQEPSKTKRKQKVKETMDENKKQKVPEDMPLDFLPVEETKEEIEEKQNDLIQQINDLRIPDGDIEPE